MNQVLKHWKTQLDKYEWEHVSPNEYFDITNIKQEIYLHMVCDILTGTFSPSFTLFGKKYEVTHP